MHTHTDNTIALFGLACLLTPYAMLAVRYARQYAKRRRVSRIARTLASY